MDTEVKTRLDIIEAKLDKVLEFTGGLEKLLGAYLASGKGGLFAMLMKTKAAKK